MDYTRAGKALLCRLSLGIVWAVGCGSDSDDGAACQRAASCGGDVLGAWEPSGACYIILSQPKLPSCDGATADLQVDNSTGKVVFDTDTYSTDLSLDVRMTVNLPKNCMLRANVECSKLQFTLGSGLDFGCKDGANGACACDTTFVSNLTDSGIYEVAGKQLKLKEVDTDYCVQGKQMTLLPKLTADMGAMGTMTSQLQVTLSKP
jgi:hypothetical protein